MKCNRGSCNREVADGNNRCQYHREIDAAYRVASKARKLPGMCTQNGCPRKAKPGTSTCERCLAKVAAYQRNNPERQRVSGSRTRIRLRQAALAAYGGKCATCGEADPVVLQLDHINGREDGEKGTGVVVMARLRKQGFPQGNYQILCANCHARKTYAQLGFRTNEHDLLLS